MVQIIISIIGYTYYSVYLVIKEREFKMRKLFLVLSLLFCIQVQADVVEIAVGDTIGRWTPGDTGTVLNLAYVKKDRKYPIEYSIGWVEGSKNLSRNSKLYKNQMYASVGLRKYWGNFFVGGGVLYAKNTNHRLSTNFNLKAQFGYSYRALVLKLEHISNGMSGGENDGEDFYLIAYSKKL